MKVSVPFTNRNVRPNFNYQTNGVNVVDALCGDPQRQIIRSRGKLALLNVGGGADFMPNAIFPLSEYAGVNEIIQVDLRKLNCCETSTYCLSRSKLERN